MERAETVCSLCSSDKVTGGVMLRVGFLGAGNMAQALAKGFISAGLTKAELITASCPPQDVACIEAFQKIGAAAINSNKETMKRSQIVFIAVKPPIVSAVLEDIKSVITKDHLLLSIAMGITIQSIEEKLPSGSRVIRVMPNTPALVLCGASVFCRGCDATDDDVTITKKFLQAVGTCDEVPEYMLDAVTALSGSGPAYVFIMIEALADGGVRMGLPRDLAYRLAAQTVYGAGRMVLDTKSHPAALKDNVTSPAGTTAEGLFYLEQNNFRASIIGAVQHATEKAEHMNK